MAVIDIQGRTLSLQSPAFPTNPNADLAWKAPVRVATTGQNITLTGTQTIDSVALVVGDRVLVKDQTDQTTNGIYNVQTGPWTRTIDANDNSQWASGVQVMAAHGISNGDLPFVLTAADPIVLGTSLLTFQSSFTTSIGTSLVVLVTAFGADPTGVVDSTTAIQNAINSLPASGGTVFFPVGAYKVSSTLTIGNGTTTAVSTTRGVILLGAGIPTTPGSLFWGTFWPVTAGPKLVWAGGATPVVSVNGPLEGWGIQNLYIDGTNAATDGILVTSAAFGDNKNLTIVNCTSACIFSTSHPLAGYSGTTNVDSIRNNWNNLYLDISATTFAKAVVLTGDSAGTSNTDYNTFINTIVGFASSNSGTGIYLGVCDSNVFINTSVAGMPVSGSGILLDYSVNSTFPLANMFYSLEVEGGTPYNVNGSPGAGSKPNYVIGAQEANGGTNPNGIAGFGSALPFKVGTDVVLRGQTAGVGGTALFTPFVTGQYRVNWYLAVTVTGTGGSIAVNLGWNDGSAQTATAGSVNANGSGGTITQGSYIMYAAAGNAINYSVTFSSVTGSPTYNVFITLERLV